MRILFKSFVLMLAFAVCCIVTLPGISAAEDEYRVIGELTAGPGVTSETFPLYEAVEAAAVSLYTVIPQLKSISIDVSNGAEKTKNRVTAAVVIVNGDVIFKESDFNARVLSLSKTLEAEPGMAEVAVSVEVKGRKNSNLTLRVIGVFEVPDRVPVIWYLDVDGDGFGGVLSIPGFLDSPPPDRGDASWVTIGGDCNDYIATRYPGSLIDPCP